MCSKDEQNQAELEKKISELKQEVKKIEGETKLKERFGKAFKKLKDSEYKKEYVAHLDRLHQYNDAKDAALSVLGQLGNQ